MHMKPNMIVLKNKAAHFFSSLLGGIVSFPRIRILQVSYVGRFELAGWIR